MLQYFLSYSKPDIAGRIHVRKGETKLGEVISVPGQTPLVSFLQETSARFIIVGIAEDIGVLANGGKAGTAEAWDAFLSTFLNTQSNDFINAENIAVLGHFSFDEIKQKIERKTLGPDERIKEYRKAVTIIDDEVSLLTQWIVSSDKIPIFIGGGHNNSYPIIKGSALGSPHSKTINCVNLDAHIDYRLAEGRHSGNGFRYAKQEGYLNKYFVLGIHENYIPNGILKEVIENADIDFITYEDIFINQKKTWQQALEDAGKFIGTESRTGLELDLDSIENVPSSAATPLGLSIRETLHCLSYMIMVCRVSYLHICEGMPISDHSLVGKLIAYLVTSFIKAYSAKTNH
jgi:formiminoglutamase